MTLAEFQPFVERAVVAIEWEFARSRHGYSVTADMVAQSPLRSVPMDLITDAVVRRVLKLPPGFPILSVKVMPPSEAIEDAVRALASRWKTPNGQMSFEEVHS